MDRVFKDYSKYYDLIYNDKDYKKEANYVEGLIKKYQSYPVKSIINLGCGTGKHDFLLAEKGYETTGIDISNQMLEVAQQSKTNNTDFHHGDIRTVRLNKTFDAVISLFHVINYQTSNKDLRDTFLTAKSHLKPGGILIFDFWYGPGVLSDEPGERKKEAENEYFKITRYTTPVMHSSENIAELKFEIDVTDKESGENSHLLEFHKMRYLFLPELQKLLHELNFEIISEEEWLTGNKLTSNSWNACIVARTLKMACYFLSFSLEAVC